VLLTKWNFKSKKFGFLGKRADIVLKLNNQIFPKMKKYLLTLSFLCLSWALQAQFFPDSKPFKPAKGMVNLTNFIDKTVEVKKGQKCYFQDIRPKADLSRLTIALASDDDSVLEMLFGKGHLFEKGKGNDIERIKTSLFEAKTAGTTAVRLTSKDEQTGEVQEKVVTVVVK